MDSSILGRRIDAAMGRTKCDFVIRNVDYLDVFNVQFRKGDVAFIDGVIVGVDSGLKGREEIDGKGRTIVPGFIDAHVHLESSLMTSANFERAVLPRGTTTVICDPHELTNVHGNKAIEYFLESARGLSLDLRVMLSSCVPATGLETNGAGAIGARDLIAFASHPKALGLAEVMNVPGVLHNDPDMLEKLVAFGKLPIDGHAPLVRGKELSAYLCSGISSCHESTESEEALEKIRKGMSVWIREGSVAKDLHRLAPLLTIANSTSLGFCTDDRNPLDIMTEGHLDFLVRETIRLGIPPEIVFRAASWSVARHYGLSKKGAVAPGFAADLVVLSDRASCEISEVFCAGKRSQEISTSHQAAPHFGPSVRAACPSARDLEGPTGRVHVIGVISGKIITENRVEDSTAKGVARLTVLERHGKGGRPSNGYARGFGEDFDGAVGSSVGHDSHNLIVVGSSTEDMRVAFAALIEMQGGFVVVKGGKILASLALPIGGLISPLSAESIEKSLRALHEAGRAVHCVLPEPFLQLAFLTLPVIPHLKITDKGLVDVDHFKFIPVSA